MVSLRRPRQSMELRSHNSLSCYLTLVSYQIADLVTKTVNGIVFAQQHRTSTVQGVCLRSQNRQVCNFTLRYTTVLVKLYEF